MKRDKYEISRIGNARHFKFPFKRTFTKLKKSAERKSLPLSITYEQFLEFTKINECFYCKNKINWIKHGKKVSSYNLDRKDSFKGYHVDNVVVCCWKCNNLKSNKVSHEDFVKIAILIKHSYLSQEEINKDIFLQLNDFSIND